MRATLLSTNLQALASTSKAFTRLMDFRLFPRVHCIVTSRMAAVIPMQLSMSLLGA